MKFFGKSAVVVGAFAATFVACGSDSSDKNAKSPEPQAMNQLTPSERQEAEKRAAKEDERERQLASSREPTGSSTKDVNRTTNALAVSSIATARCDRELKCKNIGSNKTYLSTNECITKLQNDKRTDLNADECPGGVSDKDLSSCLKAIREEDCGNPLDSISRLTACRSSALCLK
jgi:hypothetical protein